MAPADRGGYTLLPQADVAEAGGLLKLPVHRRWEDFGKKRGLARRRSKEHVNVEADVEADVEVDTAPKDKDAWFWDEDEDDEGEDIQLERHETLVHRPTLPHVVARKKRYEGGLQWKASVSFFVIHPFNPVIQVWNALLMILLLMDMVLIPIETAYANDLPKDPQAVWNRLTTGLFSCDLVLQFFLQIPSPSGEYWIFNHGTIVSKYLQGNFLIDLVSIFPLAEVKMILFPAEDNTSQSHMYILHLLRFIKLLRISRLKRILKRWEYNWNLSYMQRAMLFSGVTILGCLHVSCCVWATFGNYELDFSWIMEHERHAMDMLDNTTLGKSVLPSGRDRNPWNTYLMSTYFSIYTLTGIGYGDITPASSSEYSFVIVAMLVGSLVWATIIGEIVSVIKNSNFDEEQYQLTLDQVLHLTHHYNLDADLCKRLQEYFLQSRLTHRQNFVQERVMSRMSSELAIQLAHSLHGEWYSKVWWLNKVSKTAFMVELTLAFEPMLYCPQEIITATDRLFVISKGLAIHGAQVLGKNSCWGVDILLSQEHLRHKKTTVALSYLHVLYLSRVALARVLSVFPRERAIIRKSYRTLVFMRGMVWTAQKMLKEERMAAQRLEEGVNIASLDPGSPAGGPKDMFAKIGKTTTRRLGNTDTSVFDALAEIASQQQMHEAFKTTKQKLETMDKEFGGRMDSVQASIDTASAAIATLLERRNPPKGKPWSWR